MTANLQRNSLIFTAGAVVFLLLFLLNACGGARATPGQSLLETGKAREIESKSPAKARSIIIGDVDPDEPVKKIRRFRPLADYLASQLGEFDIVEGGVIIAQSFEEMGKLLRDGEVDIYFDSLYPAIASQNISGSEFLLRRSKDGVSSYWSTYVVLKERMVDIFDEFLGKIIAFEEPRSTSGYLLPAGNLLKQGYRLKLVEGPSAEVADNEIGYFFREMKKTPLSWY